MQTVTLEQLRATTDAGGVLGVTLKAQGPAFFVRIETRRGERVLVTTRRREPRKFVDPRKAMLLLREIGIREMRVDGTQWRPEEIELEKKSRPDSAQALKQAHEAKSYLGWVQDKVAASLIDPAPNLGHDQVMADAQAIIDAKRRQRAANA